MFGLAYLGEIAALGTSFCWTTTASFFAVASRRVGSVTVNRTRLLLAVVFLTLTHWILRGSPIPTAAHASHWFWLGISGVIGLVVGDALLFQAFVWVGPRLGMLMMSLAPIIAALVARFFLGESLLPLQWLAILVTLFGVALVILDRRRPRLPESEESHYVKGILFGLGAAAGQAIGLVLAKRGLEGDFNALSGNVIRMLTAASVTWILAVAMRQAGEPLRRLRADHRAMLPLFLGALTGPYIGVWLSLIAVQKTEVGVASTLMALPPVFLLPIGRFFFKESIGYQAVLGTIVAVAGVAMLFLVT